jgi:hypothetical protein
MKRSADAVDASFASAPPSRASHTLRATAPPFVPRQPPPPPHMSQLQPPPPSQNPPQKMRRTDAPQAQAFGEARRRAHEQAVREEEEYQAWRAAELAADDQPDDEEQVSVARLHAAHACVRVELDACVAAPSRPRHGHLAGVAR